MHGYVMHGITHLQTADKCLQDLTKIHGGTKQKQHYYVKCPEYIAMVGGLEAPLRRMLGHKGITLPPLSSIPPLMEVPKLISPFRLKKGFERNQHHQLIYDHLKKHDREETVSITHVSTIDAHSAFIEDSCRRSKVSLYIGIGNTLKSIKALYLENTDIDEDRICHITSSKQLGMLLDGGYGYDVLLINLVVISNYLLLSYGGMDSALGKRKFTKPVVGVVDPLKLTDLFGVDTIYMLGTSQRIIFWSRLVAISRVKRIVMYDDISVVVNKIPMIILESMYPITTHLNQTRTKYVEYHLQAYSGTRPFRMKGGYNDAKQLHYELSTNAGRGYDSDLLNRISHLIQRNYVAEYKTMVITPSVKSTILVTLLLAKKLKLKLVLDLSTSAKRKSVLLDISSISHKNGISHDDQILLYNYTTTGDSSYLDQFTMGEDVNEDAITISPISSKYGTTGGIHSDITVVLATSLYKNIVRIPKVATVISLAHTKVTLSAKRLIQTLDPPVKNRSSEVSVPRRFYDMMNRNDVRQTKNTSLRNTYLSMSIVDTVNW